MSYLFEKGQPKNCVYKLDFQKKSMDDSENYKALFEDLSWEHLQQFNVFGGRWHYFRKECDTARRKSFLPITNQK
ncbi:MAG: DUF2812 domain-containing protein [Clostridiales bacterium]|jgi:hypothetical protein|nr:DUF2812 domain-containing protein [Clostridiales bacterium]